MFLACPTFIKDLSTLKLPQVGMKDGVIRLSQVLRVLSG